MKYPHWEYFLSLDEDLERAARYVAPEPGNFSAYSVEFARLLLSACAEIEVVAKTLCEKIETQSERKDINDYMKIITKSYPKFSPIKVAIPRYDLEFQPWLDWQSGKTPSWWTSHNHVKHERTKNFTEANLTNSLNAIGGLFLLTLYYYQPILYSHQLFPWPKLFHLPLNYYHPFYFVGTYTLPDFGSSDDYKKPINQP